MPFGNPTPVTPGYRTAVVLDDFGQVVTQPFFGFQRTAPEMARGDAEPQSEVAYAPGLGASLRAHHQRPTKVFESIDSQKGFLRGSDVQVPSGITEAYYSRTYGYTGVAYNGVAAQGSPMFQKLVASGQSWASAVLISDQAAFPGPATSQDPANLDRVLVTNFVHDPRDYLTFELHIPGAPHERYGSTCNIYFCGPAGKVGDETGFGQYAAKLDMNGTATVYERGDDGTGTVKWFKRFQFSYCPIAAAGMAVFLTVGSDCVQTAGGGFKGKRLVFRTLLANDISPGAGIGEALVSATTAVAMLAVTGGQPVTVFAVPQKVVNPTLQAPVRIDVRRDVLVAFSASRNTYPLAGKIVDDSFTFPFHPTDAQKIRIEWYGSRPSGTSVAMKLFRDDTGAEVTGTRTVNDEAGEVWEYDPPSIDCRTFHVEFDLTTGNDPGKDFATKTPSVQDYRVYRSAVVETPAWPTRTVQDDRSTKKLPTLFPSEVRATASSEDPETENMTVTFADLTGADLTLPFKTGTPVQIELRDPATDALKTIVQSGIIGTSDQERLGTKGRDYPKDDAYKLTLTIAGEYADLRRALLPYRFVAQDPGLGTFSLPMKATDAVYTLFREGMGVPDSELDIPDLPQRLFTDRGGEDLLTVEPGNPAFEVAKEIVSDYTGGYLFRDKNAGARGKWRMALKRRPPYNNVLKIYRDHPGPGKLAPFVGVYPDETSANGQVVKATCSVSERIHREPPEGNFVQVFGSSADGSVVGGLHKGMLTQCAFNQASFNYLGLDSSDPHYPDPDSPDFLGKCVQIQVYDPTLATQDAVNWVTRRVFDAACFGREVVTVVCPIVLLTDVTDAQQTRPRLPRFNDPCLYQQPDGSFLQYLVVDRRLNYSWDGAIMMELDIVTTTNITTYGLPIGAFDLFDLTRARIRAAKTATGLPARSRNTRWRQREFRVLSGYTAWPGVVPGDIQFTDPGESNFGQFKYMVDYDPVP